MSTNDINLNPDSNIAININDFTDTLRNDDYEGFARYFKKFVDDLTGQYGEVANALNNSTIDKIWPIGSIYVSVSAINPGTTFGVGTWVAFGTGHVPVGVDANNADFNTVEKTGGSASHTLTWNEMPIHNHSLQVKYTFNAIHDHGGGGGLPSDSPNPVDGQVQAGTTDNAGLGYAFNIMNPYICVYMWKRTA
jgi:microcystin-dependent protein